ncbi:NERD domain-containing protein [Alicyclobacillus sp. ALC3]|uniref:NERD domain-containing protein n=1 Tax=Alicyclobacillus sp. ALC3 TaxID=2796143 RepID=UPI00237A0660|nr:NERD domain-containing protein [Alicyclobacillus sp. ALC3]WDL95805.1 NERD domain-containing protein [Alicyclobacillus sp. ALC3]
MSLIRDVPQADQRSVQEMQKLLDVLPSSHKKRALIESDLFKMLSGESGEKSVAYQLDFWFRNAPDVAVANNVRLEFNDRSAQIDHIVAVPAGLLVLESKSLPDQVHIDEDGNWYRVKRHKHGEELQREGMFSPVEQNRRHMAVLEDILSAQNFAPKPKLASVIVFPNPKVVITGVKPAGATLARIDTLQALIERSRSRSDADSAVDASHLLDVLLSFHRPITIDVYERYHIDPTETKPMNERVLVDPATEAYICAFCSTQMAVQKTRHGIAWGCGRYPQCKNMVPASIVAQVGNDFVARYNKEHFWTSRARRCPNCGGKMVEKRGRSGRYVECANTSVCKYKEAAR